jgi:Fe-S-cluster containining protein
MTAERVALPVIELSAAGIDPAASVSADVGMTIAGRPVQLRLTIPTGPAPMGDLLPLFHGLTNLIVNIAEKKVEESGEHISCRAGCGACCRQIVPISESEAHALRRLVDAMPEPRRSAVRQRFADAVKRMADAGMLKRLRYVERETNAISLGLDYFRVGVPCPFLEEESCSIHRERPLACREYLVTSPPEFCATQEPGKVRGVEIPGDVSRAVRAVDKGSSTVGWVPLLLALDWAETHPEPPASQTGPAILEQVFQRLAGKLPPAGTSVAMGRPAP